jgi:hypothetical protein
LVYDVIIAGAGPVGLFLACELRLGKLSVLVLEPLQDPHSPLKRLPFGMRGLWGPSIEAFYRRGLLQQIASQPRADDDAPGQLRPGSMASGAQLRGPAGHFAGIQFDYSNIDASRWPYRLPSPADTQLGREMEHLERVLAAHALSIGVEIQRGHGVESFEPSNDGMMRPDSRALAAIVRDLIDTRDGATYFAERVWGVSLRYDLGDEHALVGRSCPDFELEDGTRLGTLLRGGNGLLLDFGRQASLQALDGLWGERLRYVAGQPKDRLGLSALLVRPDGFVAWASDTASSPEEVTRAAARWFTSREHCAS